MNSINSWKSNTAALLATAIATSAIAPMMASAPAVAQLFPQQTYPQRTYPQRTYPQQTYPDPQTSQVTIPAGTSIPVRYNKAEKIVVSPDETMPLTLTVATNIVNRSGSVLIPAGTQIVGQIQPVSGGSQFVAREIVISQNRRQQLNATSEVFSRTEEIRRGSNTRSILKGAVIGAAAASAISLITGNKKIAAGEVLGGAGLGAVSGVLLGRRKAEVIVINPSTDMNLTLNSSLPVAY